MDPVALSFMDKIGLSLQGAASWQQLQSKDMEPAKTEQEDATRSVAVEDDNEEEDLDVDMLGDEAEANASADAAPDSEDPQELAKKLAEKLKKDVRTKLKMERFNADTKRDAGDVLTAIDVTALVPGPMSVTWDRDPELLCCYNWHAGHETNTILVPGGPAKWTVPTLPFVLEPDQGYQYNDYNYARQPRDPYAPMFHALGIMNPNYQFNDVDVLADRNNLRLLLEVCQKKANAPFRLHLFLVQKTLIIVRKEAKWWKRHNGGSRGCNFEKFFAKPAEGMEDATNHYRAIRFPMGPLNVVVRYEADAYDDGVSSVTQSEAATVTGNMAERPRFTYNTPIQHLQKGHVVPNAQIVELKSKTHSDGKCFERPNCQDQLWFGRTSLLYMGPYKPETGIISHVRKDNTAKTMEWVKNWEANHQEALRKVVTLLSMLRAVLEQDPRPNHGVVLVREEWSGPLVIRKMRNKTSYAVKHAFLHRHWPQQARGGAYRGQRGGRGAPYAARGRGQNHQQPYHSRGGGHFSAYNGHGPSYTPTGYTERRTSPDYSRGGRRKSPEYSTGGRSSNDRRNDPTNGRLRYHN